MDGRRDFHTEQRKLDREDRILQDITFIWNLKKIVQIYKIEVEPQMWKTNL